MLERTSSSSYSLTQMNGQTNGEQFPIYRDINKVGTVKSKQNTIAPIQIPLRDIFDFCHQATELDTTKTGTMTIALELNVDKLDPVQRNESTNVKDEALEFNNITTEGTANTVTTKAKFTDLNQSFYYVGQKLKMDAQRTGGGGAPIADAEAVISSIVWNDTQTLTISFENKWGDIGSGESLEDVKCSSETVSTAEVSIDYGEITLVKLAKNSSDVREIEYSTFSTDETTNAAQESYQRLFQVEADADAVVCCFPENGSIASTYDGINTFRCRVDNQDLTDRDVAPYSPLYNDRINMTMSQMSLRLKNLLPAMESNDAGEAFKDSLVEGGDITTIMNPVNQTTREKQFQLNINASPGVEAVTLFKHRPRQLKL